MNFKLELSNLLFSCSLSLGEALALLVSLGREPLELGTLRRLSLCPGVELLLQSLILDGDILQVPGLLLVVLSQLSHLALHLLQSL